MADKLAALKGMDTRQKITIGVMVVVVIVIIWQIMGLFGGGGSTAPAPMQMASSPSPVMPVGGPPGSQSQPKPVKEVPDQVAMTAEELAMQQAMQQAQAQYMAALNNLQMLRMTQSIAEVNKNIMSAKLDAVVSEKKIVDLLSGPAAPLTGAGYGPSLVNPTASGADTGATAPVSMAQATAYTVVSVVEIQGIWSAVLGNQGVLYNVRIGDVLPVDNSTVVDINSRGVTLELNGERRILSLVSII